MDHWGEHISGLVGLTFGEVNNGGGQAHIAGVALLLADLGERRMDGGQPADVYLRLEQSRLNGRREDVLAACMACIRWAARNAPNASSSRPLREAQETSRVVHDQLGGGSPSGRSVRSARSWIVDRTRRWRWTASRALNNV